MTWATRFRAGQTVRHSLWLVPLLGALAGLLLGWAAAAVEDHVSMPASLTFTPSTATAILSAIIGAAIGLIGFVVTVTVLLVQTATGQFSARYMRLLYRDQLLKAVLAVLVGTFAYAFVLLRRVGETSSPDLGLILLAGLVLLGVVLFLVFLSRTLQRLRPAAIAAIVRRAGVEAFLALAPPAPASVDPPAAAATGAGAVPVTSDRAGAIQAMSLDGLVAWATRHDCTLVLRHGVGDFVHPGTPLLDVAGAAPDPRAAHDLRGMIALGRERTIEQDPAFAVRVMVDVANRALSAAVNDPTTATQVLDYIEDLLLVIGGTDLARRGIHCGGDGRPRVVVPSRSWEDYLSLGVTEIRLYGAGDIQVVRRLRALLLRLRDGVLPEHRAAVDDELERLDATVRERFGGGVDLGRAMTPDPQGLGGVAERPRGDQPTTRS